MELALSSHSFRLVEEHDMNRLALLLMQLALDVDISGSLYAQCRAALTKCLSALDVSELVGYLTLPFEFTAQSFIASVAPLSTRLGTSPAAEHSDSLRYRTRWFLSTRGDTSEMALLVIIDGNLPTQGSHRLFSSFMLLTSS
jgi:hypothetical protein